MKQWMKIRAWKNQLESYTPEEFLNFYSLGYIASSDEALVTVNFEIDTFWCYSYKQTSTLLQLRPEYTSSSVL